MDEYRKRMDQDRAMREKMAYEMLVKNGNAWAFKNGPVKLAEAVEQVRVNLRVWNKLTGSTVALNLATVDLMLQQMSTVPFIVGMDMIKRPEYTEYVHKLSAIRNHLIAERNEKMKRINPELSTGGELGKV